MSKTVLAIDPGTSKCGMALVHLDEEGKVKLLWHEVVPRDRAVPKLHEAYIYAPFHLIIIGGGTNSRQTIAAIRDHLPSMGILVVDEKETTIEARARYWEHNRRRGWRRLWPSTLQVPPEPVDDFVALILAERVLTQS